MENNVLCQRKEQVAITGFFEEVSNILKECDECEEKNKIKEVLHSMNDTVSYVFLGEDEVGKTTLLKELFQNILEIQEEMHSDICEYRYGEMEFSTEAVNGYQKKFVTNENIKGISVIDTRGLNNLVSGSAEKINELIKKCEVMFLVLDAQKINSPALWDLIEEHSNKKMIFFLTKCDLVSREELAANIEKVKCYMEEANISAPVFSVSGTSNVEVEGITPLSDVSLYIRNQVVGVNPILNRQRNNIEETKNLLDQMKKSFMLRQKQYNSDVEILQRINQGLDTYILSQEKVIGDLVSKVTEDINKEIDAYQDEIISKIDPYKIKERFKTQQDFSDYLNMVNENYKNIMTASVNKTTMKAIKNCLHELEIVFDNAVCFFQERENILALNDKFYGSLSVSRKNMVAETKEKVYGVNQYYKTLSEASETLFLQIWEERKKHDTKVATVKKAAGLTGGAVGAVGGTVLAQAILSSASMLAVGGLVTVGVIVGAVVLRTIAKKLYEPIADERMEEVTQKCIEQFKTEVNKTRVNMIEQVALQIRDIFKAELASVDGYFTEFRMSVNLDERRILGIETKLAEIDNLLETIESF